VVDGSRHQQTNRNSNTNCRGQECPRHWVARARRSA
jgi:hypothetical protein